MGRSLEKRLRAALGVAVFVASLTGDVRRTPAQTVYRSGVDLVFVTATVVDRDGRFVAGLSADDFVVSEEGRPQTIVSFTANRVPVMGVSSVNASRGTAPASPDSKSATKPSRSTANQSVSMLWAAG